MLYNLNVYSITHRLYLNKTRKIKLEGKKSGEKYCKILRDMLKNVWIIREKYHISTWEWSEVKWKVAQSCLTLCDPLDYTVHGILQARILEWVDFPFSRGSSQPRDWTQVSRIAGRFFTSWATREAYLRILNVKTSYSGLSWSFGG